MIDNRTAPWGALLLRVTLGVMFIAHALLKYSVFTLPGTAKFFASLGLPGPLAYGVFWAELIGGTLILVGCGSRWASAALVPVLLGALWAHLPNGWVFSAPNGGWEYPAFLAAAAAAQALIGDGAYAIGGVFQRRRASPEYA